MIDTRESLAVALAPVRCLDCDGWVPAGWIDYTDAPKCPASSSSHRVPTYVLTSVVDVARNAGNLPAWTYAPENLEAARAAGYDV